jgi:hypothetical protein
MPVFLEPGQSFPVVLNCDKDKPAESRPEFLVKSQSMRGMRRIAAFLDRDKSSESFDEIVDKTLDELVEHVVGWRNIEPAFSRKALEDVLTYTEASELLRKIMVNQHVGPEEKKD